MSFFYLSTGILDHCSFANCSRCLRLEGCLLPTTVLRSLHRCSMGFRSGLWPLQNSPALCLKPFLCAFWSMLWVIVLLEGPWPLTETQLSDTGPYIALQNYFVVFRFHDVKHAFKARSSKATPKHLWTSTLFDRGGPCSFLWMPHLVFCKQYSALPKSSTLVSSVHLTFSQNDFGKL